MTSGKVGWIPDYLLPPHVKELFRYKIICLQDTVAPQFKVWGIFWALWPTVSTGCLEGVTMTATPKTSMECPCDFPEGREQVEEKYWSHYSVNESICLIKLNQSV